MKDEPDLFEMVLKEQERKRKMEEMEDEDDDTGTNMGIMGILL